MSEINAAEVMESMREAGFIPPQPAGVIVERSKTSKRRLFGSTLKTRYWRLWIGGKDYRDYDSFEEADAARVLMGL